MAERREFMVLPVAAIREGERLRRPRPARVAAIAASMKAEGQRTPIEVTADRKRGGYDLVRGAVRLAAARLNGEEFIQAHLVGRLGSEERRRREIDDNLAGDGCTVLDRARYLAARKAIYETEHPDAAHGGARRGQAVSSRQIGDLKFAAWAANRWGRAERTVERLCTIGERLDAAAAELLADAPWADHQGALEQISRLEAGAQQIVARQLAADPDADLAKVLAAVLGRPEPDQLQKNWDAAKRGLGAMSARDLRLFIHQELAPRLPPGMRIVDDRPPAGFETAGADA